MVTLRKVIRRSLSTVIANLPLSLDTAILYASCLYRRPQRSLTWNYSSKGMLLNTASMALPSTPKDPVRSHATPLVLLQLDPANYLPQQPRHLTALSKGGLAQYPRLKPRNTLARVPRTNTNSSTRSALGGVKDSLSELTTLASAGSCEGALTMCAI